MLCFNKKKNNVCSIYQNYWQIQKKTHTHILAYIYKHSLDELYWNSFSSLLFSNILQRNATCGLGLCVCVLNYTKYTDTVCLKILRGAHMYFTWWTQCFGLFGTIQMQNYVHKNIMYVSHVFLIPVMSKKLWLLAFYDIHFKVVSNRLACPLNHSEPFMASFFFFVYYY